jgi:hypothetical protein
MAFRQADPISIDRIVYVSLPSPASDGRLIERRSTAIESTAGAPSAPAYLAARNHVLRWGVEELPEACGSQSAAQPVSVESLLGLPPGTNEPALKRLIQSLKPGA